MIRSLLSLQYYFRDFFFFTLLNGTYDFPQPLVRNSVRRLLSCQTVGNKRKECRSFYEIKNSSDGNQNS